MSNIDYRLFVGSENKEPLTPIFKGKKHVLIYPGDLNDSVKGKLNKKRNNTKGQKSGLRRYIFRYNKGTFEYLATRMGQRNGGFNSTPNQTLLEFTVQSNFPSVLTLSAYPLTEVFRYNGIANLDGFGNRETYSTGGSANSIINYNTTLTRWEWKTRPASIPPAPPGGPFNITAYSSTTDKALRDAGSINGVTWTVRGNPNKPIGGGDPESVAIVKIKAKQWFNNNTVANLNRWPIQNQDAQGGKFPSQEYKWQTHQWASSTVVNITKDGRPDCLSDEFLFKCFKGVELKEYDTVFVEVVWRYLQNMCHNDKNTGKKNTGIVFYESPPIYRGYNLHDVEWFSPKPFYTRRQKGRVYRIGKLAKSNPVNEFDTITFAQRTRIVTTKWYRGGNTALE